MLCYKRRENIKLCHLFEAVYLQSKKHFILLNYYYL